MLRVYLLILTQIAIFSGESAFADEKLCVRMKAWTDYGSSDGAQMTYEGMQFGSVNGKGVQFYSQRSTATFKMVGEERLVQAIESLGCFDLSALKPGDNNFQFNVCWSAGSGCQPMSGYGRVGFYLENLKGQTLLCETQHEPGAPSRRNCSRGYTLPLASVAPETSAYIDGLNQTINDLEGEIARDAERVAAAGTSAAHIADMLLADIEDLDPDEVARLHKDFVFYAEMIRNMHRDLDRMRDELEASKEAVVKAIGDSQDAAIAAASEHLGIDPRSSDLYAIYAVDSFQIPMMPAPLNLVSDAVVGDPDIYQRSKEDYLQKLGEALTADRGRFVELVQKWGVLAGALRSSIEERGVAVSGVERREFTSNVAEVDEFIGDNFDSETGFFKDVRVSDEVKRAVLGIPVHAGEVGVDLKVALRGGLNRLFGSEMEHEDAIMNTIIQILSMFPSITNNLAIQNNPELKARLLEGTIKLGFESAEVLEKGLSAETAGCPLSTDPRVQSFGKRYRQANNGIDPCTFLTAPLQDRGDGLRFEVPSSLFWRDVAAMEASLGRRGSELSWVASLVEQL